MIRTNLSISSPFSIYFVFLAIWLCYFSVYFIVTVHNTSNPIHSHKSSFLNYDYDYQSQDKAAHSTEIVSQTEKIQNSITNQPLKTYAQLETTKTKAQRLRAGNIKQEYEEVKVQPHSFYKHIHVENPTSVSYDQDTYESEPYVYEEYLFFFCSNNVLLFFCSFFSAKNEKRTFKNSYP